MNPLIASVVEQLRFGPDGVRIVSPLDDQLSHAIDPTRADDEAVRALSQFLYCHLYAACPQLSRVWLHLNISGLGRQLRDPVFILKLRAANPGSGWLDPGWTVSGHEPGGYHVKKDGLSLFIEAAEPSHPPALRTLVPVRFPSEVIDALPGFYIAHSDRGPVRSAGSTRIYLNLKAQTAPQLIRDLLETLLGRGFRHTLKVVNNPTFFSRRDNCVLYVARSDFDAIAPLLLELCRRHPGALDCEVPAFTLRLRDGIGVADSPADEVDGSRPSFGQQRMHALGTAMIEALANGARSPHKLAEEILVGLASFGIDPDRPWLATPTAPDYRLVPEVVSI